MEFFDVVGERRSVRAYRDQAIEAADLQRILRAVNGAPSAGNLQAYEVYVVCDPDRRAALVQAAGEQEFLVQAPVVLVFCAHAELAVQRYGRRGTDLYCLQDATIACTFAMLAAAALGLSTVWVGAFDERRVREIICAPEAHRPVAMLPIGYAAETPRRTARRELKVLVHYVQ